MKKTLAVVVVMLLALTLCVSLCACSNVAGTYKFESMEMKVGGLTVTFEAGQETEFMGQKITYNADAMVLELKADGTAKFSSNIEGAPEAEEGKWEEKDGKVIVTYGENESVEFKLEDGKLVMEQSESGASMKFVLAK